MKAIVYEKFGPPEVLHLAEVEKPAPKDDEVLIKVHATSVATGDCNMRNFVFVPSGFRTMSRLMFGPFKPKKPILGVELAGEIEAVGSDVTEFRAGDQVFGLDGLAVGAYAEYKVMKAKRGLTHKPSNLTFQEAAAIPNGALTAYTYLKKMIDIQAGQKILIVGASGSIGTAAVQIAKHYGAEVTGVCSGRNAELIRSLGADHVIDYTQEDFTTNGETYDLILDTVGKISFAECKGSLAPQSRFLSAAGGVKDLFLMLTTSFSRGKKVKAGPSTESKEALIAIKELVEAGAIKPVIDRCYPLEQTAEAHRYVDTGRKRGNVIISVVNSSQRF